MSEQKYSDLQLALQACGDTTEEVVLFLKNRNCQGYIGDSESCPLANYLQDVGFNEVSVTPSPDGRVMYIATASEDLEFTDPDEPLFKFVTEFDEGEYPDLVIEPSCGCFVDKED